MHHYILESHIDYIHNTQNQSKYLLIRGHVFSSSNYSYHSIIYTYVTGNCPQKVLPSIATYENHMGLDIFRIEQEK